MQEQITRPLDKEQRKARGQVCMALRELCDLSPQAVPQALNMDIDPFNLMAYEHQNPKMLNDEMAEKLFLGLKVLAIEKLLNDPQVLEQRLRTILVKSGEASGLPLSEIFELQFKPLRVRYEAPIERVSINQIRKDVVTLRLAQGLSGEQLAKKMNFSGGVVAHFVNGRKTISPELRERLLLAFECDSISVLHEKAAEYRQIPESDIPRVLKTVSEAHALKPKASAEILGLSEITYDYIIAGKRPALLKHLVKLQHALQYPTFSAMIEDAKAHGFEPGQGAHDESREDRWARDDLKKEPVAVNASVLKKAVGDKEPFSR